MKFQTVTKILGISMLALVMTGCGSSGSSSSSSSTPPPPPSVLGGTPSTPAILSLDMNNEISTDDFYNYFQYTGQEDEKLFINVVLDKELGRNKMIHCNGGGGPHIAVYDVNLNLEDEYDVCGTNITIIYPTDSTYIIHFKYNSDNYGSDIFSGYFNASSVKP